MLKHTSYNNKIKLLFLLIIIFINITNIQCAKSCPCDEESLCKPIMKRYDQEIFIFSVSTDNWKLYDWDKITTIAEVGYHNSSLLCHAHSKGARVVSLANFQPTSQLVNKTARSEWIKSSLNYMIENYLDGINVDFESAIYGNETDIRAGLTALVQELSVAMKKQFPFSQLSFDFVFRPLIHQDYEYKEIAESCDIVFDMAYDMVWNVSSYQAHPNCDYTGIIYGRPSWVQYIISWLSFDFAWSSECIDGRCYDYKALTATVDFAFIMAYDERSQIFGPCVAWANSGVNQTEMGIDAYKKLGVPLKKLVLGVPWYGYIYQCERYDILTKTCHIKSVPFRGVNCSDASGSQVSYAKIVETYLPNSTTGRLWDDQAKSPYFTYQDPKTKSTFQIWYDDPTSLKLKYSYATNRGLRGVGMWEADDLDYSDTPQAIEQREAMWGALP